MEEHRLPLTAIAEWVFETDRQFSPLDLRFHLIDIFWRNFGKRLEQTQEILRRRRLGRRAGFSNVDFVKMPRLQINRINRDQRFSIELCT